MQRLIECIFTGSKWSKTNIFSFSLTFTDRNCSRLKWQRHISFKDKNGQRIETTRRTAIRSTCSFIILFGVVSRPFICMCNCIVLNESFTTSDTFLLFKCAFQSWHTYMHTSLECGCKWRWNKNGNDEKRRKYLCHFQHHRAIVVGTLR